MSGTERPAAGEEATRLLAAIVESSEDAIVSKTLDGIVTNWNKAAERIFGYTAIEMIGQPISLLTPPGHADEIAEILGRIKAGERVEHYKTERLCKDGRIIQISLTVSPIRDQAGRIVGASKIARDITEAELAATALSERRICARSSTRSPTAWSSSTSAASSNPSAPRPSACSGSRPTRFAVAMSAC
jgi:two-component system, LuxR family, sensor kinase FixL